MEGEIMIIKDEKDLDEGWEVYDSRYTGSIKYKGNDEDVLLKFIPEWWRYTEFKSKPKKILTSEG